MIYDALFGKPLNSLITVGCAGIVVWYFLSSQRPTTRLVVQILFFAVMTLILIGSGIEPHRFQGYETQDPQALLVILAKSLWWVHLAWAVIGFIRLYLVLEGSPREARLLQDLVIGVVYIGMVLSILAFVFGVPIGTLVATSGVVAIILGLALQNTLADVFSGIALTLGRPYVIGDWILLSDGTEGRVVESNWRATHILTPGNNIVVLPNSFLAKLGLTNISRPDETHLLILTIRIAPTRMPASVRQVMLTALASCNSIVREPPPVVALKGLDATSLEVELQFRVTSPSQRVPARNEVLDLVYRHCKSAGLLLAIPPSAAVLTATLPTEENAQPPSVTPLALIDAIPVFATLTSDEKQRLAETATVREFRKGDVIVQEGEMLPALMMVRAGIIAARHAGEERGRLAPGDFFGETGLLAGMQEVCTLEALTSVITYEIDQEAFAPLLAERPTLAEEIAEQLAGRAERFRNGTAQSAEHARSAHAILKTIRTIFGA
ncbi:cyclic nucleotide-binding domain-containing protein [Rhizobium lentis]|uniref:Small-conductance mechanosensitive channel n=1 Tax=Rhizobium lentis TaxID=1138194 RepID=A0A7W8UJ26_9HYPH|nr:cyclic nucleotide-binding domain-containing protein [Rhizobium lentis]MBB4572413.1 small-conductance mechanosensitive channel [Rhizobium lentis]MBB5548396.1 small-conductance mechanosensitive channel [Rhizobium lentis]MBB5558926.1 small-conductance mechanosensitive channel [Rhizobium lentis]MBB5565551.1 small-conductance mechanosensitive channel [Rhizobium lentis]